MATDRRIALYAEILEALARREPIPEIPLGPPDDIARLGSALRVLAAEVEALHHENEKIDQIARQINSGLVLDDILEYVFDTFHDLIPYDRIGFSLIEYDEGDAVVRARWSKSRMGSVSLDRGYAAPLAGSSLETILKTGQPRIINDLEAYAAQKPRSESSRLIVNEGIRSSLTCPLIANGIPTGFMFFSSAQVGTYHNVHIEVFQRIAGQLSIILEKGYFVSAILEQRAEIEEKNEELRRLDEVKNRFIGIAAHDLRSPLSNIHMAAQVMAMEELDIPLEGRKQMAADIGRQVSFMLHLLDDLLDISRIESGHLELAFRPIDLGLLVIEAASRHSQLAAPKAIRVETDSLPDSKILADADRLRQVLDNLISNAIKFSPPERRVQIRVLRQQDDYRVEVQDEGPGFSEQDQSRLFQDFAQLSAKPTGGEKSTGLGLGISRRIIEAHGGHIGAESRPGAGATLWFTLPAAEPSG